MGTCRMGTSYWEEGRERERHKRNHRVAELSLELGTPTHNSDAKRHVCMKQMNQSKKLSLYLILADLSIRPTINYPNC